MRYIMPDIYFCSDHHIDHENILTFKDDSGNLIRPFDSLEHMQETIIENHNKVVRPQDKVYFLGDVAFKKEGLKLLGRMNGHKRLVRGNHDIFPTKLYMEYFEEIYGVRVFSPERMACSHIPIHPESLERWNLNVHGHLHQNKLGQKVKYLSSKYLNVSMEQINYTPISFEEIKAYAKL